MEDGREETKDFFGDENKPVIMQRDTPGISGFGRHQLHHPCPADR